MPNVAQILSCCLKEIADLIYPMSNGEKFDVAIKSITDMIEEYHEQEHDYTRQAYVDYYAQMLKKIKKDYC